MTAERFKERWSQELQRIKKVSRRNVDVLRSQPLLELSGSFGDIGTFIPILIVLTQLNFISASSTLVFSGIANILTGLFFGIPLPVQPMKAIAAVAISAGSDFSDAKLASAGLFVSGVVGLLSLSGLIRWFTRVIPIPIVKGIQVGAGLSLMISAFPLATSADKIQVWFPILCTTLVIFFFFSTRPHMPFVLVLIVAYTLWHILSLVTGVYGIFDQHLRIWAPRLLIPSLGDFGRGTLEAGLGQVPLTTLNSVIAVVFLAEDLFPNVSTPSATLIGLSVCAMNMAGCWFSAMPVCHGSGGLAAQYRFGARSGTSVIFLGVLKLALGLFASEYIITWCNLFPKPVLGFLVFLAGLELAKMGESLNTEGARDLWEQANDEGTNKKFKDVTPSQRMRRWLLMTVTAGTILGTKNDGIGFIAGMALHSAYKAHDSYEARQFSRREGRIRLTEDDESSIAASG